MSLLVPDERMGHTEGLREHYGFSEDYELYHRLESMEPEDYRERRLRGEIPDAVEVDVRLAQAVEKVFERLCSPPPVQYLDKLYEELAGRFHSQSEEY